MKKKKLNFFVLASLIISFLSFLVVIWVVFSSNLTIQTPSSAPRSPEEVPFSALTPSEVLNKKSLYSGKEITIRGKVIGAPVVCERKECPVDDSCCGCPWEKNLVIVDEGSILSPKTKERLKLLGMEGKSLCHRLKGGCRYECGDWKEGGIYGVYGEFWAEAQPPGWSKYLDFYFKVEDKKFVKSFGFGSKIALMFQEIKNTIKNLKSSGSYILH